LREQSLRRAFAEADERDAVAPDVRAPEELRERALRLADAVERHAPRSVHGEDEERARLVAEAFEAEVGGGDFQCARGHGVVTVQPRQGGGVERGVERETSGSRARRG
jgi:hypothetical protein